MIATLQTDDGRCFTVSGKDEAEISTGIEKAIQDRGLDRSSTHVYRYSGNGSLLIAFESLLASSQATLKGIASSQVKAGEDYDLAITVPGALETVRNNAALMENLWEQYILENEW